MITVDRVDEARASLATRATTTLIAGAVVLKLAWFSDDAAITSRVVANLLNGYGPNFNITERAQAATHPLWMLLVSGVSALGPDIVLTMMLLGVVFTGATFWLLVRRATPIGAFVTLIAFVFSYTLVEFGTSGLENSLSWFLIAAMWTAARSDRPTLAGMAGGLAILNRLDVAIVVLSFLAIWIRIHRTRERPMTPLLAAVIPGGLWVLASWVYYGDPLPETFYAKLNTAIPIFELVARGFYYLYDLVRFDLISSVIIVAGCVIARASTTPRSTRILVLCGTGFYGAYVIRVGGDFMSGRMWSIPIVCALIAIAERLHETTPGDIRTNRPLVLAFIAPLVALPLLVPIESLPLLRSPLDPPARDNGVESANRGVLDEWAFYVQRGRGLMEWARGDDSTLDDMSASLHAWTAGARVDEVWVQCGLVGGDGVLSGPTVHFVVHCGLSDPFLARIPFDPGGEAWRIGHFHREIPTGYLEALVSGDPGYLDPEIRTLFERTSLARRIDSRWGEDVALPQPGIDFDRGSWSDQEASATAPSNRRYQ